MADTTAPQFNGFSGTYAIDLSKVFSSSYGMATKFPFQTAWIDPQGAAATLTYVKDGSRSIVINMSTTSGSPSSQLTNQGSYTYTGLDQYTDIGTYTLQSITVQDTFNNYRYYAGSGLTGVGKTLTVGYGATVGYNTFVDNLGEVNNSTAVSEGQGVKFTFTNPTPSVGIRYELTTSWGGTTTGNLTFSNNLASLTVTVPVDNKYESNETITVKGYFTSNGVLGWQQTTVRVADVMNTPSSMRLTSDTGASNSDWVTKNGQLNFTIPTLGSGVAWQYSTDSGSSWTNGSTALSGGSASITLSEGSYAVEQVRIRTRDANGYTSPELKNTNAIVVDNTAPSAPTPSLVNDTGWSSSDNISYDNRYILSGLESGASWTIQYPWSSTWDPPISGSGDGGALRYGSGLNRTTTFRLAQTDLAGNVSASQTYTYNIWPNVINDYSLTFNLSSSTGLAVVDNNSYMVGQDGDLLIKDFDSSGAYHYYYYLSPHVGSISENNGWLSADQLRALDLIPLTTASIEINEADGLYDVYVIKENVAGNMHFRKTVLAIDNVAPEPLNVYTVNSDYLTNSSTLYLDNLDPWQYQINYQINDGDWVTGAATRYINQTTRAIDLSIPDGDYTLNVQQMDAAGNYSDGTIIYFTLDTSITTPMLSLVQDTGLLDSDLITNDWSITLNSVDDGVSLESSFDQGITWSALDPLSPSFSIPSDGSYTIIVRAEDAAGNVTVSDELAFTLDTAVAKPSLTPNSLVANGGVTNDGRINVSNIESGAYWEYKTFNDTSWDGSWTAGNGTQVTLNNDGVKQVKVRQIDLAGNMSDESDVFSFTLDTTISAPVISLQTDSGSSPSDLLTKVGAVVVNFDVDAVWQYSLNENTDWVSGSGSSFSLSDDGTKSVSVRAIDAAGNVSSSTSLTFTLDTTLTTPLISLVNDSGVFATDRVTNDGRISITGIDPDATWQYSLDAGSNWNSGTGSTYNFSNTPDGNKSFLVKVTDTAGNVRTSDAFSFTLDTVSPLLSAMTPSNTSTNVAVSANFVFDFNENVYRAAQTIPLYWMSQYGNTLLESFNVASTNKITINEGRVTINPSYDLNTSNQYSLSLPEGFVQDLAGNAAEINVTNYSFQTRDTTAIVTPGTSNQSLVVATVIDLDSDGYGLYQTSSGAYVVDVANLDIGDNTQVPLTLKAGSKNYAPKVAPSALLVYNDNTYGLIAGSGASWTEQKFNSAGATIGGATKLTPTQILEKEKAFAEDIDRNGTVGDKIAVVYDSGAEDGYGLYKTLSGFYVIDVANLEISDTTDTPLALKTGTKDFTTKVAPSALLAYENGSFGLISGSGIAWSELKFNSAGASGATTKLNLSQLLEKERTFQEDINKDNVIGDKVTAVYDLGAEDGYGLYKTMSGDIIIDTAYLDINDVTDNPMTLRMGTKSYSTKVAPKALLAYDNGSFGVVAGSGNAWTEQKFNSAGLSVGSAAKLTLAQVLEKENTFLEDINGDGFVGDKIATVADNNGYLSSGLINYGLYKSQLTSSYYIDETEMTVGSTFTDTALKIKTNATTAWTPGRSTIVGMAEKDSGYLEILTRSGSTFSAQKVDADTGLTLGAAARLTAAQVTAREAYYDMDLNGNGTIQLLGLDTPPTGWDA
jgi:Bacterial Ig-like domain